MKTKSKTSSTLIILLGTIALLALGFLGGYTFKPQPKNEKHTPQKPVEIRGDIITDTTDYFHEIQVGLGESTGYGTGQGVDGKVIPSPQKGIRNTFVFSGLDPNKKYTISVGGCHQEGTVSSCISETKVLDCSGIIEQSQCLITGSGTANFFVGKPTSSTQIYRVNQLDIPSNP